MTDEVYRSIAEASSGFLEAPAGCGKTDAIVRAVADYCPGTQLVLTHTYAGVDALRRRFRQHHVSQARYHVDTIAGWAWSWVRRYPSNGRYAGPTDIPMWDAVYSGMSNLLCTRFVQDGIRNSYMGVLVDEYQDCTLNMHNMVAQLKQLLPCRVLGDDLQGIFGFREDALVDWADVKAEFKNDLGVLSTPHRWICAGNENLGRWLLSSRDRFREGREPEYRDAPVKRLDLSFSELGRELIRMTHARSGRVCVIGPKARPLPRALETTLVGHKYRVLEPNDLSAAQKVIVALSDAASPEKADTFLEFVDRAYGGVSADERLFMKQLLTAHPQKPRRANRRILCDSHSSGTTPALLLDLLRYLEAVDNTSCKLKESVSALTCVLEAHAETKTSVKALYAEEVKRRKYQRRDGLQRCIGSTLLVKGLEFDHVIVLRGPDWPKTWGTHKDLYVALSRGSRSVTLVELKP